MSHKGERHLKTPLTFPPVQQSQEPPASSPSATWASPIPPALPLTSFPLPGAPLAHMRMEPIFLELSLSALQLVLVQRLQPQQPPLRPQLQQPLLPPPQQCLPRPPQPQPRLLLPPPQLQQTCDAPATQCRALQQESPVCSPSPGRGRASTPAPRRGMTRASSGPPQWSTRRATMSPARDNTDSALKHVTRDSGGSREKD